MNEGKMNEEKMDENDDAFCSVTKTKNIVIEQSTAITKETEEIENEDEEEIRLLDPQETVPTPQRFSKNSVIMEELAREPRSYTQDYKKYIPPPDPSLTREEEEEEKRQEELSQLREIEFLQSLKFDVDIEKLKTVKKKTYKIKSERTLGEDFNEVKIMDLTIPVCFFLNLQFAYDRYKEKNQKNKLIELFLNYFEPRFSRTHNHCSNKIASLKDSNKNYVRQWIQAIFLSNQTFPSPESFFDFLKNKKPDTLTYAEWVFFEKFLTDPTISNNTYFSSTKISELYYALKDWKGRPFLCLQPYMNPRNRQMVDNKKQWEDYMEKVCPNLDINWENLWDEWLLVMNWTLENWEKTINTGRTSPYRIGVVGTEANFGKVLINIMQSQRAITVDASGILFCFSLGESFYFVKFEHIEAVDEPLCEYSGIIYADEYPNIPGFQLLYHQEITAIFYISNKVNGNVVNGFPKKQVDLKSVFLLRTKEFEEFLMYVCRSSLNFICHA